MKRYALLLAIFFLLLAHSAAADCWTYDVVDYQATYWWDGTVTYLLLGITEYTYCTVGGGSSPSSGGGGGTTTAPPVLPTVTLASVDTSDIYNPIVAVDVTSNDANDPVSTVILEVNGITADYTSFVGNARYQFHIQAIPSFADGNYTLNGKACSATGNCGENAATMSRFTPSPATAGATINASWQEEDPKGLVTRQASYGHDLRQM